MIVRVEQVWHWSEVGNGESSISAKPEKADSFGYFYITNEMKRKTER